MGNKATYGWWQKIRLFFLGDPSVPEEKWRELDELQGSTEEKVKARIKWYMENLYPYRSVGFFSTQRPLQSPRMAKMLADPDVAPIIRNAMHDADRKAVRDANADRDLQAA